MARVISQTISTGRRLRATGAVHGIPDENTLSRELEMLLQAMEQNAALSPLMSALTALRDDRMIHR